MLISIGLIVYVVLEDFETNLKVFFIALTAANVLLAIAISLM